MRTADEASYRAFVESRIVGLRHTAYLLCGDWHTAEDLTSVALMKLLRHWRRVRERGEPDAYVRRILLRAWLDERRRPWRREVPIEVVPEIEYSADSSSRLAVLAELAKLPPRRRAVLVLRFFCDLSVEDTAEILGCSPGTVKSQASRAIDSLRVNHLLEPSMMEE